MIGNRFCVVLVLLIFGFVSAVGVDFDCPDDIFVDEEFECSLEVFDGDGEYDVKVELDTERNSVLKIWDGERWISGYYYVQDFIEDGDDENVKLIVSKRGNYDGVLKLRQGDRREFFEIEMRVREGEVEPMVGSDSENLGGSQSEIVVGSSLRAGDEVAEVISLGEALVVAEGELVYESRDAKVVDYLPYGFCVFLIFVIMVLVWERF